MAKKKLSKALAWALTAAMAVNPGNLIWASETNSAEAFTDNSENVEPSAEETTSEIQNELAAPATVSDELQTATEGNDFTDVNPVEVFSAGNESEDGEYEDETPPGEIKTFTGPETFQVKENEIFNFIPAKEATYRVSTNKGNLHITFPANTGLLTGNYYTFKATAGYSYRFSVTEADTSDDITVTIEEVPAITGITVDNWSDSTSLTYPVEPIILDEIDPDLPVTLTLEGGKTASGTYDHQVNGYGNINIVFEDSEGNLMWSGTPGDLDLKRPSTPGVYRYYFFCEADPSIRSKAYTFELKSFNDIFSNNKVTIDDETMSVTLDKNAYIKCFNGYESYNYGFWFKAKKDETYYFDSEDRLSTYSYNSSTGEDIEHRVYITDSLEVKAGRTYYIALTAHEPLKENTTLTFAPAANDVKSVNWFYEPTPFITDFTNFSYFSRLYSPDLKVKVTYNDDSTEEIYMSKPSTKLGKLQFSCETDEEDEHPYVHYYLSKNPSISQDYKYTETTLDEVKDDIPSVKLNDSVKIDRNFNSRNTFKFTAPETDKYNFEFSGTPVPDTDSLSDAEILIKDSDDRIVYNTSFDFNSRLSLDKGDTVYVSAGPCYDDFTVKISSAAVISDIAIANPEVLSSLPLYKDFLQYSYSNRNLMKALFKDINFEVTFSDGSKKTAKIGEPLNDYGTLVIDSIGNIKDEGELPEGSCNFTVYFESDDEEGEPVLFSIKEPALIIKNVLTDNTISGLSDTSNSSKSYSFQETGSVKHFYIENTSEYPQVFNLSFQNHSSNDENPVLGVITDKYGFEIHELYFNDAEEDKNTVSVTLTPQTRMYLEYFGTADSVNLTTNQIQISSVQLDATSSCQLIKDTDAFGIDDLNFNVTLLLNGKEETITLNPNTEGKYNLKLDAALNTKPEFNGTLNELDSGDYKVTCRISALSEEEFSAGTVKLLSYKDLFRTSEEIGNTVSFDNAQTYNNTQCIGIEIPENGDYVIYVNYKNETEDNSCMFFTSGIEGRHSEIQSGKANNESSGYLKKGLLMLFANGASDVTILPDGADILKNLRNECNLLISTDYEEESWKVLSTTLTEINAFLESIESEEYKHLSEIAENLKRLSTAKNNLKKKTVPDPVPTQIPTPTPTQVPSRPDPDPVPIQTPTPSPTQTPTPSPTPSPLPSPTPVSNPEVPEVEKASVSGNKATVKLTDVVENAEGYDFVICSSKKDLANKNYLDVRKNQTSPSTTFSYLQKGTYYVYCHAWTKVNGKKVFSKWSDPYKLTVTSTTVSAPKIKNVTVKGRKVTITLSRDQNADGIDIVLATKLNKDQYGKTPVNYGKLVKKNKTGTTITFTNVPDGTYYIGAHAFNRTAENNKKNFSKWSNIRKIKIG